MDAQNEPVTRLLDFSLLPIAKVLVMCGLGAIMANSRINILTAQTRQKLSKLIFSLFLPCLIFTQLGEAVTLQKMLEWWFIPVNIVISNAVGCLIGWLVAVLVKPPPQFFNLTIVMVGIGNIGNIPLVLMGAVCRDDDNPFGPSDECDSQSVAYIAFGQWVGAVVAYTFVLRMLRPPPSDDEYSSLTDPLLPKLTSDVTQVMERVQRANELGPVEPQIPVNGLKGGSDYPRLTSSGDPEEPENWTGLPLEKTPKYVFFRRVLVGLKLLMQPAISASILAIIVGAIPFLKYLLLNEDGALFFVSDALSITGSAMVPCMMLVLGGNLAGGPANSKLGMRTTVTVTIVRLLIIPLVGLAVVYGADRLSLIPANDKLFRFVLLLQHSMPTSILAGTVASIQGHGEQEISAVLFWQHIISVITMTGWLLLFLNVLF